MMRFSSHRRAGKVAGAGAPAPFFMALWAMLLLVGCRQAEDQPQPLLYSFEGSTMATHYVVKVVEPPGRELSPEAQEALSELITQELEEVDRLMSTYRADSELSRFNGSDGSAPFPVSAETARVLEAAIELGELTDGALDVTIGPLVNAWGFGPDLQDPPEMAGDRLRALLDEVGLRHLSLEQDTVSKAIPGLYVDLSSLAKGFAVDQTFEAIQAQGHANIMVEVGGEVRAAGTNLQGHAWRLGIERPADIPGAIQRVVGLADRAMATSGDYRNYREKNGVRLSHIIDPRTGRPISHRLASVSVIDEQCMWADGLATALMVLGPEKGLELADREGIAALFLTRDGEQFREQPSHAFQEHHMSQGADSQ